MQFKLYKGRKWKVIMAKTILSVDQESETEYIKNVGINRYVYMWLKLFKA